MSSILKIDQAGLPAGVAGLSRTDGLATGALVTITNTGGGTTLFELLDVPLGDATAVASLAPTGPGSNVWTFTPDTGKYGTFRIRLTKDAGLATEAIEVRHLRIRTPNLGLIVPALNEVADPEASLVKMGAAEIEASEDNANDYPSADYNARRYAGWWRALAQWILALDGFVETSTVNVQIWDPDVGVDTAIRKSTYEACANALKAIDGFGLIILSDDDEDPNPYQIVGSTPIDLSNRIGILNAGFDRTITVTHSAGKIRNPWYIKSIGATLEFQRSTAADVLEIVAIEGATANTPNDVREFENVIGRVTATGFAPFLAISSESGGRLLFKDCELDAKAIFVGNQQDVLDVRFIGDRCVLPGDLFVNGSGVLAGDLNIWIEGNFAWSKAIVGASWLGGTPADFFSNPRRFPGSVVMLETLLNDGTTVQQSVRHDAGANTTLFNEVPLTAAGGGMNALFDDGTYKPVSTGLAINAKESVKALSDSNIASLSGLATSIDSIAINSDGDRVLLTAQSTATENGIWEAHAGAWTRPTDFDTGDSAASAFTFVQQGSVYADTGWLCVNDDAVGAVIDTDNLTWVQFSGPSHDAPLSREIVVDPGTATPAAQQNGSYSNPFSTLSAAHTAVNAGAAGTSWVIKLMPSYTYTHGGTYPVGRKVTYCCLTPDEIAALGYASDTAFTEATISTAGSITTTSTTPDGVGALIFRGVNVTGTITVAGSAGFCQIAAYDADLSAIARTQTGTGTLSTYLNRSVLRNHTGGGSGAGQGDIVGLDASLIVTTAWVVSTLNLRRGAIEWTAAVDIDVAATSVQLRSTDFPTGTPSFDFTGSAGALVVDDISRVNYDQAAGVLNNGTLTTRRLYRYYIPAERFHPPLGSDWALNSQAEIGSDTNNNAVTVARFDGGAGNDEGVGFHCEVPPGVTHLTMEIWYRRESGTTGTGVQLQVSGSYIQENTSPTYSAWSTITDVGAGGGDATPIGANENWRKTRFRYPLSTYGLVADAMARLELIRDPDDASDNVAEDLVIRAVILEFS